MTDDREAVLARRRRLIALALAGTVTSACTAQPCLSQDVPPADAEDTDTEPDAP